MASVPFSILGIPSFSRMASQPVRSAVLGLEACLILLLAWACAQLFWAAATPLSPPPTAKPVMAPASSQTSGASISGLKGFPYFYPLGDQQRRLLAGTEASPRADARAQQPAAPETDLELKLFGLRAEVGAEDRGSAIIQTTDNRQGAFVPGQLIQSGVRLEQVFPDRVEILRDGVRESLYLNPDRRARQAATQAPVSAGLVGASDVFETAPSAQAAGPATATRVSRGDLREISPADALAQFQLRPRLEGSRINGFIVQALGSDPRLRSLDVQPGDVIMDVNGTRLTSFERVSELPEELRGATELRIGLIRDGRREERRVEVTP